MQSFHRRKGRENVYYEQKFEKPVEEPRNSNTIWGSRPIIITLLAHLFSLRLFCFVMFNISDRLLFQFSAVLVIELVSMLTYQLAMSDDVKLVK